MTLADILAIIAGILKFPEAILALVKALQKTPEAKHQELVLKIQRESESLSKDGRPSW